MDTAPLAMVVITCCVCTWFCPCPLESVRVVPLDLSVCTCYVSHLCLDCRMSPSQTRRNTFSVGSSLYPGTCAFSSWSSAEKALFESSDLCGLLELGNTLARMTVVLASGRMTVVNSTDSASVYWPPRFSKSPARP